MKQLTSPPQKGIGLIEVMVTTVVVAVGLLALASLLGGLMSGSGDNKTRAEALVLAERKIEDLRNNITIAGYNAIPDNAPVPGTCATIPGTCASIAGTCPSFAGTCASIAGTNAFFTRTWTISDIGSTTPNRKRISVQVSWDSHNNPDVVEADEKVNVTTEMAWIDPAASALLSTINSASGTPAVPSPRQNASEDVASQKVIGSPTVSIQGGETAGTSLTLTVSVPNPSGGANLNVIIKQIAPGSHFYATADSTLFFVPPGVIAVFLCGDSGTCTYIQNHFGGVPLRISGSVFSTSGNGLANIRVAWTSSEVHSCYQGTPVRNPSSGTLIYDSMPYECVFAGNCNATADGVNRCYPDSAVSDAQINLRNVGPGGEFGDVGLTGLVDQGGNREQVCFLEDTADPASSVLLATSGGNVLNDNYLFPVTKRFYAVRKVKRNNSINRQTSEGINRPYTNHNFLIIARGTGGSANQKCNLTATDRGIQLAPRQIIRTLNENAPNAVAAESAYSVTPATAKTYTGAVTGSATNLNLNIPEIGGCYLNNNNAPTTTPTAYACVVGNNVSGTAIKGVSDEHPTDNPSPFASCTKTTDATLCNWLNNFATTASADCTAPWGATVVGGSGVSAFLNANEPFGGTCTSETRTCTAGTLSGTFQHQSCTVATSADCTVAPFGTIANGSSVTAFATATVPAGFTCTSENRICTNGILSGSFTNTSCAVQTTRNITASVSAPGTGSVTVTSLTAIGSGASAGIDVTCNPSTLVCQVTTSWTGTLSATGSCSGGLGSPATVSGTSAAISAVETIATVTFNSCTGPVCTTPWGASVASGGQVTAFQTATVAFPSNCTSETRFCNNGSLSGSFSQQSCSRICTVPNLIGMSTTNAANISAVNNAITAAGFTSTPTDSGSGPKQVTAQNPAAGSTPACGSAISYTYN